MAEQSVSFLLGSGRCGSTALYRELSSHPDVSWVSSVMERFPDHPRLNRVIGRAARRGFRPVVHRYARPSEAYRWWDVATPAFARTTRDLLAADVTPVVADRIRRRATEITDPGRRDLLFKITGWPRVGFLDEVFSGARFVNLVRDGRAVAASLLHVGWWDGWSGPSSWRLGPLTPEQNERWQSSGRSYVVLAGLGWEIMVDSARRSLALLPPEQTLTIRYEDLCEEPHSSLQRITAFLGLSWPVEFEQTDWSQRFQTSEAWRGRLGPAHVAELEAAIGPTLVEYGYL